MAAALGVAKSEETIKGIMCTYEGSQTIYAFTQMPTVKCAEQIVKLYVDGSEEPIVTFPLADGKQLVVTLGEYVPISIEGVAADKVKITNCNGKTIIQGGKFIIVKGDKKYALDGTEIK